MTHQITPTCFKEFEVVVPDDRGIAQKAYDRSYATFSYVGGLCLKIIRNLTDCRDLIPLSKIDPPNKHLYIFIHGLDGSPLTWSTYIKQLQILSPHSNYIVYSVPKKGDCGLKEASEPLIDRINQYIHRFPSTKSICLIGKSNGSRIAARVERKLFNLTQSIHTVSISGVHQGTRMMACARTFCNLHPKVVRDLTYQSDRALLLLNKWKKTLRIAQGRRSHAFYISSEDESVVPPDSGLVKISDTDQHFVFRGYTHRNLADSICGQVLSDCKKKELL